MSKKEYIGIVLEDRLPNSSKIKVNIREKTPFHAGDIKAVEQEYEVNSTEGFEGSVKASNYIEADYYGLEANRRYPPDVKKGEQVEVFTYEDSNNYYWTPLQRDTYLRTLERYNISASGMPTSTNELTDENTYYLEIDSKFNSHIVLRTSNKNNEKYCYMVKIDTKNNRIILCDDDDNEISINSDDKNIMIRNKDSSFIEINKTNIALNCKDDVIINAAKQVVLNTPALTSKQTNGTSTTVIATGDCTIKADKSVVIESSCVGINGQLTVKGDIICNNVSATSYSTGGGVS